MILTTRELNRQVCASPDCAHTHHDVLMLTGRCHPGRGCDVAYDKQTGTVTLRCHRCQAVICRIAVANGEVM